MAQSTTFMMSRSARSSAWQRNQNTIRHSFDGKQFGPVAHTVVVVLLLSIMGLMYLSQINKTNAYTYPINELENEKKTLIAEQEALQVEAARLGSLETVKNSTVAQNLTLPAATATIE
ncbi:hypothetical protein KC973_03570 [Candidatus Saccharibacteria bacterium]|nr:hypothetical protein [Candidatus Saccharibacteria bacterium]